MRLGGFASRIYWLFVSVFVLSSVGADADELRVMSAGAVTPAYLKLASQFEQTTHHKTVAVATATGLGPDSIPSRVRRGEPVDVIILSSTALEELIKDGHVVAGSRVDVARSGIGIAVRAGAAKPDIRSVDGLKRALLDAKSIAYSAQISGVYVSTELFQRLGIADQVQTKSRRVEREPVGNVVARGEAEIGFQQISELLAVPGVDYVGPLPPEVQHVSVFSAGIGAKSQSPAAARALIDWLRSPAASSVLKESGLEPVTLSKPDFSGEWILDPQASTLSPVVAGVKSGLLRIDHHGSNVRVHLTMVGDGKPFETAFDAVSDGREVTRTQQGRTTVSSMRWDGDALVFVWDTTSPNAAGSLSGRFRYEILDGGRRLRATEQLRGAGRDQDNVWVFERR
jgi:molybdate transport system substrate-binding protein